MIVAWWHFVALCCTSMMITKFCILEEAFDFGVGQISNFDKSTRFQGSSGELV